MKIICFQRLLLTTSLTALAADLQVAKLAQEVAAKGWITYTNPRRPDLCPSGAGIAAALGVHYE